MTVDAVINSPARGDHLIGGYRLRCEPLIYRRVPVGPADKERDCCRRGPSLFREYLNFQRGSPAFLTVPRSVGHLHNLKRHLRSMRRVYTNDIYRSPRDNRQQNRGAIHLRGAWDKREINDSRRRINDNLPRTRGQVKAEHWLLDR